MYLESDIFSYLEPVKVLFKYIIYIFNDIFSFFVLKNKKKGGGGRDGVGM